MSNALIVELNWEIFSKTLYTTSLSLRLKLILFAYQFGLHDTEWLSPPFNYRSHSAKRIQRDRSHWQGNALEDDYYPRG